MNRPTLTAPLLHRVAGGDDVAIREAIDRYGRLVWSMARRASAGASDAEDAVQEIFVDLWRSAERFDEQIASDTAFVAMIARRRLIDRRRRGSRRPETEPIQDAPTMGDDTDVGRIESCTEAALAGKAMRQLRPEQRTVLMLAAYHGLSHEEISGTTGMPLGTVKAHARRGLIRIRQLLNEPMLEGTA